MDLTDDAIKQQTISTPNVVPDLYCDHVAT